MVSTTTCPLSYHPVVCQVHILGAATSSQRPPGKAQICPQCFKNQTKQVILTYNIPFSIQTHVNVAATPMEILKITFNHWCTAYWCYTRLAKPKTTLQHCQRRRPNPSYQKAGSQKSVSCLAAQRTNTHDINSSWFRLAILQDPSSYSPRYYINKL